MENLARYIIRASFSQERMTYLPEESRIIYRSKDHRQEKADGLLPCVLEAEENAQPKGAELRRH